MYLKAANLSALAGVSHGFTTRQGGNMKYPLHPEEDTVANVSHNRRLVAEALQFDGQRIVACQQVHGTLVMPVSEALAGRGALSHQAGLAAADALVTDRPGIPLMVMVADCVPILIASRGPRKVIAAVHAGWRGTRDCILSQTLLAVQEQYACPTADLLVAIGPSIGPCCFEVGADVLAAFSQEYWLNPQASKGYLDLKAINRAQALEAGVPEAGVETIDMCTFCQAELFFSFRRDQGITGRLAGFICLQEGKGNLEKIN